MGAIHRITPDAPRSLARPAAHFTVSPGPRVSQQ